MTFPFDDHEADYIGCAHLSGMGLRAVNPTAANAGCWHHKDTECVCPCHNRGWKPADYPYPKPIVPFKP